MTRAHGMSITSSFTFCEGSPNVNGKGGLSVEQELFACQDRPEQIFQRLAARRLAIGNQLLELVEFLRGRLAAQREHEHPADRRFVVDFLRKPRLDAALL